MRLHSCYFFWRKYFQNNANPEKFIPMKNLFSISIPVFCLFLFSSTEIKAQFDSIPFHQGKNANAHSLMFEVDLGGGFMKNEFFMMDNYSQSPINYNTNMHLFYKLQVGAYYPAVNIGKTGTFGPTLGAGVGLTRHSFYSLNIPLGVMARFGNNSNAITKKAWGYGMGIAIAPTVYNEPTYSYGTVFMNVPMVFLEATTKKATLRLDVLPYPMAKKTSSNSSMRIDADVSLTMCYSFGKIGN
jgi:hypothetical protein